MRVVVAALLLSAGASSADTDGYVCSANSTCTACPACCTDYVADCAKCHKERCLTNICTRDSNCNTCSECCWDYVDCDQCVKEKCRKTPAPAVFRLVCVHNARATNTTALWNALNWVCSESGGGVDCSPINGQGACADVDTIEYNADWAFNEYFQQHKGRGEDACRFVTNGQKMGQLLYCDQPEDPARCVPCKYPANPKCLECQYIPGKPCCNPNLTNNFTHLQEPQLCYYNDSAPVPCCHCGNDHCQCPPAP